jgi:general secretion pathway protein K
MSARANRRALARRRRKAKERGIALLMVMGAIAVLTVMLAEFQEDASAELSSALADVDSVQAEYYAKSAINLSRLLIASEPTIRQAIAPIFMLMKRTPPQLPIWEFSDRILGVFNDETGSQDFGSISGLDVTQGKNLGLAGGGHFEISVIDEDAKINVNLGASNEIAHIRLAKQLMSAMGPIQYDPLFQQRDSQGNQHDRLTVCSSIIDWADVDENRYSCDLTPNAPSGTGVEDYGYYTYLPKPYRIKNAPYDSLEELHVVRGMTDDLWTAIVDPEPKDAKKRTMTVWGQGTVNVNSANAPTLLALVCSGAPQAEICTDPAQMQMFIMGVTMAQGMTMGMPMFGKPQDFIATMKGQGMLGPLLTTMGMKPVKFQSESEFAKSISTESKIFSIYAVGVKKGYRRETRTIIHAVVDFRAAPPLTGGGPGQPGQPGQPGTPGQPTTVTPPPAGTTTPAANDPNSIAAALQPSTGGQILYWQVQ